ncbi:hypothetical protein WDU94_014656 [Cyamophila willieti]
MRLGLRTLTPYRQQQYQSRTIRKRFFSHPFYNESKRVAIYLNRPDEIKTRKLIAEILKSGRKVFLPWYKGSTMKLLQMRNIYDIKRFTQENEDGILQYTDPKNRTEAMKSGGLDLVVIPGIAFSVDGKRLGRGKGLYAKYLTDLKKMSPHCKTMALAFKCQVVYDFPEKEGMNVVVDHIVHPYKIYSPNATIVNLTDPSGNEANSWKRKKLNDTHANLTLGAETNSRKRKKRKQKRGKGSRNNPK